MKMNEQTIFSPASADLFAKILQPANGLWLVTGGAGFIGSNLVAALALCGQRVRVLDNFSTGHKANITEIRARLGANASLIEVLEGDIRVFETCKQATAGVSYVLHQAALGSVPRSLNDPLTSNAVNVGGFLNMLEAARQAKVQSFVYAASSSTYGDEPNLPKVEDRIGNPLSPYAVTKLVNEIYARNYALCYGFKSIGLRYFNVFGPRQDPNGAYAAVIPKWVAAMIAGEKITINGDGETSRDFCFVENALQANLLAALSTESAKNAVYNVAVGERTTLNDLFSILQSGLRSLGISYGQPPIHAQLRAGDVRHSLADIGKAKKQLGYAPSHNIQNGIAVALPWYVESLATKREKR